MAILDSWSRHSGGFRQLILLLAILALTACGTPRDFVTYQKTIADFQTATDRSASVALEHVRSINNFERAYEFRLLRENADRSLDVERLTIPVLSPAALAARDRAFSLLKQYTGLLATLAKSDAGARWEVESERTKSAAEVLTTTLSKNSDTLNQLPISNMLSPLKTISDVIAKEIIKAKRSAALDSAIQKAAPPVRRISALLREDLIFVIRQRDSVSQIDIAQHTIDYARAQKDQREPARIRILNELAAELARRNNELAAMQDVLRTLDGFDAALEALLQYAQSEKGPQDLSDLVRIVRSYGAVAEQIYESIKNAPASGT